MRRNHKHLLARLLDHFWGQLPLVASGLGPERIYDGRKQAVGTRIVELTCHGPKHGHIVDGVVPTLVVALVLLLHVAQGVQCTALVKFVERNQICKVEHVNLLELRRRAVLWGHHVQRHIAVVEDFGVGLADSARLKHDEIVLGGLEDAERITHVLAQR